MKCFRLELFHNLHCNRNVDAASPSTPILPSPSVSPALRKALVSASVRALAEAEKFCRNSLERKIMLNVEQTVAISS